MKNNKPYLFIELNDDTIIFLVVQYNNKGDFKVLDNVTVNSEGIIGGRIVNIESSLNIIKKNLNIIEEKIEYIFKKATIIINQNNYKCINVSGYKKTNGSQILIEDISRILNNIKKLIIDNETNYSLIHLFNTEFTLDNENLKKMPIGLHGNFYNHHVTLHLLPKIDLKNQKLLFDKCHMDIEKIIMKPFLSGLANLKEFKNENKTIALINIGKKISNISIFKNSSFLYSENFSFGSDMIIKDILKLCFLNEDSIKLIFKELIFANLIHNQKDSYLDEKYFINIPFKKISYSHLENIVSARINEIIEIIYEKNANIKDFHNKNEIIYISFEDEEIKRNLKEIFKKFFTFKESVTFYNTVNDPHLSASYLAAELVGKGWEKEAIPITHTKKSLISRLFSALFN